jgi:hypothetical protein
MCFRLRGLRRMHQRRAAPIHPAGRAGAHPGQSTEHVQAAPCHVALRPQQEAYSLLSRQSLPNAKPIDELVLIPYMSRVLILSGTRILLSHSLPLINSKIVKSTFIPYLRLIPHPISSPFAMWRPLQLTSTIFCGSRPRCTTSRASCNRSTFVS